MKRDSRARVAIVGAGIFGVTAAIELVRREHRVTLFDAGRVPHPDASSTDISKAVRMDYGADGFYTALAARAIEGWREWNRLRGEPLYHEVGILLLSPRRLEQGGFEADSFDTLCRRGVPCERLDARRLSERFPAWTGAAFVDGYFNPSAGYVQSGLAVEWLKGRAREAGVEVREHSACAGLHASGDRVDGVVLRDGAVHRADRVVVAAGAWTPFLLPHLERFMWATGQPVFHFRPGRPAGFEAPRFPVWCADIANTGRYGFPLGGDGVVKLGHHGSGRRHRAGDPLEVTEEERRSCVEFARTAFADLEDAPVVASRRCLYCDTWDGDFLIDRDPDREGLVVATGGSGHAFKFAPVLGPIIADAVEGKSSAVAQRFAWRRPGKRRTEQARSD